MDVFLRTYAGHLNVSMYIVYFLAAVNPTKPIRCILQHISVGYRSEGPICRNVTKNRSFQDLVHLSLILESLDVAV